MISKFEHWLMDLSEDGFVSLQLISDGAFRIPLDQFERLQHELTSTKKEYIEFITVEGNFGVARRDSIECLMTITAEYARLKNEERREALMAQ